MNEWVSQVSKESPQICFVIPNNCLQLLQWTHQPENCFVKVDLCNYENAMFEIFQLAPFQVEVSLRKGSQVRNSIEYHTSMKQCFLPSNVNPNLIFKCNQFMETIAPSLHKKWSFPLQISSANVIKSTGNCGFGHIYWRNL